MSNKFTEGPRTWSTLSEIAKRTGMSRHACWQWQKDGKMRSHRHGVQHRVEEVDLQETLKKFHSDTWARLNRTVPAPEPEKAPEPETAKTFTRKEVFQFVEDHLDTNQILEIRSRAEYIAHHEQMLDAYVNYWIEDFRRERVLLESDDR